MWRITKRGGFTLVELTVGTALLVLLVTIMAAIFSGVSDTWQMTNARTQRMQNSRAIANMISQELGNALLPLNRTDTANLQLIANPAAIASNYRNPDALFWQSPTAKDLTLGDVAVVGYFVKWDDSNSANPVPLLCRIALSDSDPNFLIYSQEGGSVPWLTDQILEAEAPANESNLYQGLVSKNVVALFVNCLDGQGRPITRSYQGVSFAGTDRGFDSRQGYTDADGLRSPDYKDATGALRPLAALPPIIQVSFVILDDRSAARIGPAEKARLISLAASVAADSPKGDASDFVTRALADPALEGIRAGLHAHHAEIKLLNAR